MNIIITGASRGFGKSIAEKFAYHGHHLYLCSRNEVSLYKTMEELMAKFPAVTIKAKPFDLSQKQSAKDFGNWILSLGIQIDVLINNAGQFIPGSVCNEDDGVLEKMLDINLSSAYHLTRTLLPSMMQQKSGHIFNICSIASLKAYPNGGAYSISKFAMLGFSRNLRHEMMPHGIKVTAVCPGAAMTDSWEGFDNSQHRIMESEDISEMIYASTQLSKQAVVEDIILRPQLGDL